MAREHLSTLGISILCLVAFGAGVGLTLLAAGGGFQRPAVAVRNGAETPIDLEAFTIEALKWDREHPPRTLKPGESATIRMPDPRIGTDGNVQVTWVAKGKRFQLSAWISTDKRSTITIELGARGYVRIGHRIRGRWRAWCSGLAVKALESPESPDSPGSDPD